MADPKQRDGFTNLLKTILPSSQNPVLLAAAISNWVSPSGQFPLADDLAYKKAGLPAAPHRFMLNISELRNVAGINAALYQLLLHYVTALPRKDTPLNINTAITADLITTGKNISLTTAKAIANARPYLSDTDIAANPTIKIHPEMASQLTTTSEFFVARSLVQLGDQQLLNNSFINRNKSTGKTRVLWQTQGGN